MKNCFNKLLTIALLSVFPAGNIAAEIVSKLAKKPLFSTARLYSGNVETELLGARYSTPLKMTPSDFTSQLPNALGFINGYSYVKEEQSTDKVGNTRHSFQPAYMGIPLANNRVLVHTNSQGIVAVTGSFTNTGNIDITPAITRDAAFQIALSSIGAESWMWEDAEMETWLKEKEQDQEATFYPEGKLVITGGREQISPANSRLAWEFRIFSRKPLFEEDIFIDAQTGEVLNRIPRVYFEDVPSQGESSYNGVVSFTSDSLSTGFYVLREQSRGGGIRTLDLLNTDNFAGAADFEDSDNFFDDPRAHAGVSVHWASEGTYDYFLNKHGRDSFDGQGTIVTGYVHAFSEWNNAQWLGGLNAMRFGDGDGLLFNELVSVDVVSHEFTHGVTQYTGGLIYQDESGALNESFSDIFGAVVEFEMLGAANGNWLIGEDVMANGNPSLRSMESPNAAGDPDTYFGDFWAPLGGSDNGGVHSNSGVQNFWFYLLTEGGSGVNDNGDSYSVSGLGMDAAAAIAYRNLATYLTPSSGFNDARLGSILSAIDLYGDGSAEFNAVIDAWNAVGVYYPSLNAQIGAPRTVDFLTEVGESGVQTIYIVNQGLDTLMVTDISVTSGSNFSLFNTPPLPSSLPELLDSLEVNVVFTPTQEGIVNGAIEISTNDPITPVFTVSIEGDGYIVQAIQEGILYASGGRLSGGQLFTVDQYNGTATAVDSSGISAFAGLDIRPSNGELFGVFNAGSTTDIYRVSATTGRAFEHVTFDVGNVQGIAFDNNDDLYVINFTVGLLYKVNPDDGSSSLIAPTGVRLVAGMAINPLDGQLWAISANGILYQIDKSSGASTMVGPTGLNRANEIVFDGEGKLYGIDGYDTDPAILVELDPATALASVIGPMGFDDITGLAARGIITGLGDGTSETTALPTAFQLHANYPNPFNPSTQIRYDLPQNSSVKLQIFNSLGQLVRTLVSEEQSAGFKTVEWDGRNQSGTISGSGIYLYRLETDGFVQTRKMILLK